jgi:hypothetical protein
MSGKWDSGELSEKEIIRAERNTGNVSTKLREIQVSMTLCFTFIFLLRDICRLLIHAVAHGALKCWMQMQNYQKKMEQKIQREDDLRSGLRLYKSVKHMMH